MTRPNPITQRLASTEIAAGVPEGAHAYALALTWKAAINAGCALKLESVREKIRMITEKTR